MALLLLLAAATTAKADDCATTPPIKPQKEQVEAYLRALYPSTQRIENAVAAFEALDYLYADRNILEPPRFLAKQVPPLPYAPEGAYYAAKPAHRKKAKWLAGANANRWRAPVRRRNAARSAVRRASTVGGRDRFRAFLRRDGGAGDRGGDGQRRPLRFDVSPGRHVP